MKKLKDGWQIITPTQAEEILKNIHENQRSVRRSHVIRLANDMIRGRWKDNPSPIIFSKEGKLLDGQHRLTALMLAKKSINLFVANDTDQSVYSVLDRGLSRSITDSIHAAGHKQVTARMVATIRAAMDLFGGIDDCQFTDADILAVYLKYKDEVEIAMSCGYLVNGVWKGMILRALVYYKDSPLEYQRILRLCSLISGKIKQEEMLSVDFSILLHYEKNKDLGFGGVNRRVYSKKYQAAIVMYANNEPFKRVYKTEKESLPPIKI